MSTPTVVRYEPRGAAKELFRFKGPEVLMSGAAGTGKSVAALMKIHLACLNKPGVRALFVRKRHSDLTGSTLVTFRTKVAQEAILNGLLHFFGGSAQEPASFRYGNGSVILVGGLDRASRLLSTEFDLVFVDEATEVADEDLNTIVSRLRNGVLSYQQLIMATNPGSPNHHLKKRCESGRCQMLFSRHEDNPRYYDNGEWTAEGTQYLERLESLTGHDYERLRWGKWVAAEGMIFENFDERIHVIEPFKVPEDWRLYLSIDFGYVNPFVCQWWRVDHDDRMYLTREIYLTKTLVEDHAKHIMDIMAAHPEEPEPHAVITDHDAEDRATIRRHLGYSPKTAFKAVERGIQNLQARFPVQPDGKPRIFFFKDAVVKRDRTLKEVGMPTCTYEEIPGYIWDDTGTKGPKETPVKLNDHGCDAMRYAAARVDRVRAR